MKIHKRVFKLWSGHKIALKQKRENKGQESMNVRVRVVLGWACRGFTGGFLFSAEFQCCYFCESSCLFYLSFNFDFYVSKIMHL